MGFAGVVPCFFCFFSCLQSLSDDNYLSAVTKTIEADKARGAASEAGGGHLLVVVVAVGVRKWQASRFVCMTNGQTGVSTVQLADPLVFLCLGGGTSMGPGLAEGPLTLLRGKHEVTGFRGSAFNCYTIAEILNVPFFAFICT